MAATTPSPSPPLSWRADQRARSDGPSITCVGQDARAGLDPAETVRCKMLRAVPAGHALARARGLEAPARPLAPLALVEQHLRELGLEPEVLGRTRALEEFRSSTEPPLLVTHQQQGARAADRVLALDTGRLHIARAGPGAQRHDGRAAPQEERA